MQEPRNNHGEHDHIREFTFPCGKRRITFHRKHVAFICQLEEEGQIKTGHVLIAVRTNARPCPVLGDYSEVLAWWKGQKDASGNSTPALQPQLQKPTSPKRLVAPPKANGGTARRTLTLPKSISAKG